ncbi:cell wall-associated hydrolase [Cohnella kolymensis]|uniref:Cell wall-associated hydrolase n=2 Tax=Cohnella kolymensis TaxID=1590652 RepID=A0ABR4ZZV3_9BACL|nr:cell wall-associated hydrolase [Cohnella kolymensis]
MLAATLTFAMLMTVGSVFVNAKPANAAVRSSSSTADRVIETGMNYLGVPYVFGAKSGRTSAFDCSSFTQYIFKQNGISIPRSSRQQSKVGVYVSKNNLQAGDLVFSDTNRDGRINHVSVYMGNGKLLHTYRKGIGVTVSNFEGSAWDRTYVTARRVIN